MSQQRVISLRVSSPDRQRWTRVHTRVAETPEQRARGLMGTEGLADDEGMLFLMPERSYQRFWMRDVGVPLDIAWLDGDPLSVQAVSHGKRYDETPIFSPVKAKAVLELAGGWFERHGLGQGTILVVDDRPPPGTRRDQNYLAPGFSLR